MAEALSLTGLGSAYSPLPATTPSVKEDPWAAYPIVNSPQDKWTGATDDLSARPIRLAITPGRDRAEATKQDASDPWAGYPIVKAANKSDAKIGVVEDSAKSLGGGLIRGTAQTVGLVTDVIPGWLEAGADFVEAKIRGETPEQKETRIAERKRTSPLAAISPDAAEFMKSAGKNLTTAGIQQNIENYTGPAHVPQTTTGKFVGTAGEFIPGSVLAPGGILANIIKFGVLPGVASEAAGQATEGTGIEPYARGGAAILTGGVAALASRPSSAAAAIRNQLPDNIAPQVFDQAGALMERAAQQGVQLTWPEALSQAAGRPVLSSLMRHTEAAPQTEARMAEFFGQRPQQIDQAGRRAITDIAPVNDAPSTIGRSVGEAAEGIVGDTRQTINRVTQPLYDAASTARLDAPTMARIRQTPGWDEASRAVRGDPQLNRHVANLQDDQVGFLNEVKKYFDQAAENAAAPVNQQRNMQRSAGYGMDAETVRNAGRAASPEYAQALDIQRIARERYLQPLLDGPLGKLADKDQTTKAAIDALFPANPLPNSVEEIRGAVGALAQRNPRAAQQLVRAHVESVFNETTQALQGGANQAGAAKFAAVLVGNPQQRANLEAAVGALPHGTERLRGLENFLEVAQATGTRQGKGSLTSYNDEFLRNQSASGVIVETGKALMNPLKGGQFLADKYQQWKLGKNLGDIADILTDPQALNRLRAIARLPRNSQTALNTAVQLANSIRTSSGHDRRE